MFIRKELKTSCISSNIFQYCADSGRFSPTNVTVVYIFKWKYCENKWSRYKQRMNISKYDWKRFIFHGVDFSMMLLVTASWTNVWTWHQFLEISLHAPKRYQNKCERLLFYDWFLSRLYYSKPKLFFLHFLTLHCKDKLKFCRSYYRHCSFESLLWLTELLFIAI